MRKGRAATRLVKHLKLNPKFPVLIVIRIKAKFEWIRQKAINENIYKTDMKTNQHDLL